MAIPYLGLLFRHNCWLALGGPGIYWQNQITLSRAGILTASTTHQHWSSNLGNPSLTLMIFRYILCVTIGPAFLSAAIYLCLARVVVVVGEHVSRLRPQTYTVTFMICDLVALLLQAAGGALASSQDLDTANMGIRVMMAGLSAHVISLALFITLCSDLAWRVRTHRHELDAQFSALRSTRLFRFGLIGKSSPTR